MRCCATPGVLALLLFGAAAGSAFGVDGPPPRCTEHETSPGRPTPPPVTTLRTRDAELAIYSIDGELRYSVIERSGRVAMHLGTQADFVVHFPRLAEHVDAAFADESSWLDASRDRTPRDGTPGGTP